MGSFQLCAFIIHSRILYKICIYSYILDNDKKVERYQHPFPHVFILSFLFQYDIFIFTNSYILSYSNNYVLGLGYS